MDQSPLPGQETEKVETFNFGEALKNAAAGLKIRRIEWEDQKDTYGLIQGDVLMVYKEGKYYSWTISKKDILATDWIVVEK